jgi:hypothetical protein
VAPVHRSVWHSMYSASARHASPCPVRQWVSHGSTSAGPNLDYGGCHWHPSRNDHQLIADRLSDYLATLPLRW